jgi:hypothetical protein
MSAGDLPRKAGDRYYGDGCHRQGGLMTAMPEVRVDAYVLDTLMADLVGHDRQPSAFLVYLFLWRRTHGSAGATAQVSLLDISTGTGLSKRSVQEALRLLAKRRLLSIQREGITAVPVYTVLRPWLR